jgi:hypothetical protein
MKAIRHLSFALLACFPMLPASVEAGKAPTPIPLSQVGAKATADYNGDAIRIASTAEGARLHTAFQKLSGTVTNEGLWLDSTSEKGGRLRVAAVGVGRMGPSGPVSPISLPTTGSVSVTDHLVTFARPGLTEEYSVSVDGVRQDFVVAERPAGTGALTVELAVRGARAEAATYGAKLILDGSQRVLATAGCASPMHADANFLRPCSSPPRIASACVWTIRRRSIPFGSIPPSAIPSGAASTPPWRAPLMS